MCVFLVDIQHLWLFKNLKIALWTKKCPLCNSPVVKKYGKRKSVQRYRCMACGHRFSGRRNITKEHIWEMYLHGKQTIAQISACLRLFKLGSAKSRGLRSGTSQRDLFRAQHWCAAGFRKRNRKASLYEAYRTRAHQRLRGSSEAYRRMRIPYPGDCHRWSAKAVCCPFGIQDTDVPVSHGSDNEAKND